MRMRVLALEDVDDNDNDRSLNSPDDDHPRNDDDHSVEADLLHEICQLVADIQDPSDPSFSEGNSCNEIEGGKNANNEQWKEETGEITDTDFPEFKLNLEEFFPNDGEWNDLLCYEGMKEGQRLHRILLEKIEKEKEVKRQGMLLRQKLYEELLSLRKQGRQEQQEERANTQKFLALTFFPDKKKFSVLFESPEPDDAEPTSDFTNLFFQTELDESAANLTSDEKNDIKLNLSNLDTIDSSEQKSSLPEMLNANKSRENEGKPKTEKNFLKRNIELAKDASNMVAMTASEKKRIAVLLEDLDNIPDYGDDIKLIKDTNSVVTLTPSEERRIAILLEDLDSISDYGTDLESNYSWNPQGEGFTPSRADKARMSLIDCKLKSLMSESEFNSVASTQRSPKSITQRAFISVVPSSDDEALKHFGEKALLDSKEERIKKERLKTIDKDIMALYDESVLDENPAKLDENTLLELLESCASTMSECVSNTDLQTISDVEDNSCLQDTFSESGCGSDTLRNQSVSRKLALLMESPPCLSEETLQKLLKDAVPRSHRFSTPREFIQECESSSRIESDEEHKELNDEFIDSVCSEDFFPATGRRSIHSSLEDDFLPDISSRS